MTEIDIDKSFSDEFAEFFLFSKIFDNEEEKNTRDHLDLLTAIDF